MSMRPIDFQSMVPKVSELTRTHHEQQQRDVSQQQQQAAQTSQGAQVQTQTVHQQDAAQKAEIREKRERQGRSAKKKPGEQDEQDDSPEGGARKSPDQPAEGRTIDIRI